MHARGRGAREWPKTVEQVVLGCAEGTDRCGSASRLLWWPRRSSGTTESSRGGSPELHITTKLSGVDVEDVLVRFWMKQGVRKMR